MAKMNVIKDPDPIDIDQWLGINESVGKTEIKVNEWISGFNVRVTKNMNPQKRPGSQRFIDFEAAGNVQGLWEGTIDGKNIMLICWNGKIYQRDMSISLDNTLVSELITIGAVTIIGSITDLKTDIFWMQGLIFFKNGVDFKQYDGTTYQDAVPYEPTVAINSPPLGGGTLFEEVNLLTGAKKQTYVGDNTTLYQLSEVDIDSDLLIITVDGATKVEITDFTVNRTLGQVTFVVAPPTESAVSIKWVKVASGNADLVLNHKYSYQYGVDDGVNLFIFGNINERNVFRFSGVGRPTYFAANSFVAVGNDEFSITDMKAQYRQIVVFKQNECKLINPVVNPNYADNSGLNPYNFGYEDLSDKLGNVAPNMVQLIDNKLVSMYGHSFYSLYSATSVENERNTQVISDRLKLSLQVINLANAVTFDYEFQKELWVNIDDIVYIWNYGNDTMYKYSNIKGTCYIDIDGDIYYGSNGTVQHVSENFLADGEVLGDTIPCKIYGGFSDFGTLNYYKNMKREWVSIASATRTSLTLGFATDRVNEENVDFKVIEYKLADFCNWDFDDCSFLTNDNPQAKRQKMKVKKFVYLQWIFENNTNNESLTILKLLLKPMIRNESK